MKALLTPHYRHNYNGWLKAQDAPERFASEEALRNDRNDIPMRVPNEHNAGSRTSIDHSPPTHVEQPDPISAAEHPASDVFRFRAPLVTSQSRGLEFPVRKLEMSVRD